MGAFTPFKRRANTFKYTPRYYDPTKEERELRRAELLGTRMDRSSQSEEYTPGEYIRNQAEARAARRGANKGTKNPFKVWIMLGAIIAIFILGSMLYESVVKMMIGQKPNTEQVESVNEEETFNPEATIIIVPNDYVEE